jgi:hypothetical protein
VVAELLKQLGPGSIPPSLFLSGCVFESACGSSCVNQILLSKWLYQFAHWCGCGDGHAVQATTMAQTEHSTTGGKLYSNAQGQ